MSTLSAARTKINLVLLLMVLLVGLAAGTGWLRIKRRPGPAIDLAPQLHLQWVRELPPQKPAWPDQPKLHFDVACRPVVYDKTLLVGSTQLDSLLAFDTETGVEKWRFTTDGPVRFAPAVWQERIYLVSDDGYLYCLDGESGELLWKVRGGPSDRKVLGNERLISTWPARGAPVVADGIVYFAAGIWPFMGIFIHAVDADTGAAVWSNDGDGSTYMKQPHFADAFAGVAPQGTLVAAGDKLLVPGGRSVPACYDRKTGTLLYYRLAANSKTGGGADVTAYLSVPGSIRSSAFRRLNESDRLKADLQTSDDTSGVFVNGGAIYDLQTGDLLGRVGEHVVMSDSILYSCTGNRCEGFDLSRSDLRVTETLDRKGQRVSRPTWRIDNPRSLILPAPVEAVTRAGSRLYAGMVNQVCSIDLPLRAGKTRVVTQATFEGRPGHLLTADGRLFVSTREGRLYCFGPRPVEPISYPLEPKPPTDVDEDTVRAVQLLASTGVREGYCVVWGIPSARFLGELARNSNIRIIAFDPDEEDVNTARAELMAAGLYGERVAVHAGDPDTVTLPPYLATLMIADDPQRAGLESSADTVRKVYGALRPYGGTLYLSIPSGERTKAFSELVAAPPRPGGPTEDALVYAKLKEGSDYLLLCREGKLAGAASWTHEHADAANTRVSHDQRVKAPLGLLWFGGPPNDGILPRHGHGPQPQVIDGRAFIEGVDMLRAIDVYTGRLLWEARLPGLGKPYNNLAHQPGANARGTNYISTADGIYVAYGKSCLRLDPATGKTVGEFKLTPLSWDYINVEGDYLIAGGNPAPTDPKKTDLASSMYLTVMDRQTGKVLWKAKAQSGFRHNAICTGGGRLYAIDRPASARYSFRGDVDKTPARIVVYDLRTGKQLWSTQKDVFGTWLSYSAKHDVLVEAGRVARDSLYDEPRGMRAYAAARGKVLWLRDSYLGPAMIHGDVILKDKGACELFTGEPVQRTDPITGQQVEWTWTRNYGCNTPAASEHLLTFRSGAAGYFDLCHDGGTGNFGGFRSSCTHNLVVADGVLCSPDYTRTCTCSYQNQASIALVHMPEAEMWTFYGSQEIKDTVRQVGINLGAPGNRKADNGTLWLEHPSVGGPSPKLAVTVNPPQAHYFRRHASQIEGDLPWVAASGVKGVSAVVIPLVKPGDPERTYTVRLHFIEPDHLQPGERIFDVALQGELVLDDFDIAAEAGAANRGVVKEFKGVKVRKDLTVTLTASEVAPGSQPVLCGVEVVAEGW